MKRYIISLAALMLFITSCVKDTTNTIYEGPDLLEFANPNPLSPVAPLARTVTTSTSTTPKNDSMYIQLVGKLRPTPTNVYFEVDAASTASSSTDYTIVTPSPVVIPANELGVKVRVVLKQVTSIKTLLFNITSGENAQPSANFKTFTYTIR